MTSFGYHGELLLPVEITPPADLKYDRIIILKAHAEWLVCKEKCIPGETDLSLQLAVENETPGFNENWVGEFADVRNRLPLTSSPWRVTADFIERDIVLNLIPPMTYQDSISDVFFFPDEKGFD